MVKRTVWGLATLYLLVAGWFSTSAQVAGTSWSVQLYDSTSGKVTTVDNNGQVLDTFLLPLAAGFDHYPVRVAVGHSGSLLAYVATNSTTYQGALIISQRDRLLTSFNLPLTLATSMEFVADESVFSEDDSRVALGYSLEGGGWGIIVLNLVSGGVDYSLRSDLPIVGVLGIPSTAGLTPVIRQFSLQIVTFNLVASGTEAGTALKGYDWKLDSNDLIANPVFVSLDSDRFDDSNEVIMTAADERLDNQNASFSFFQANSLQVYEILTGARFPVFNMANVTLHSPRFIQNGERILVDTATADGRYAWTVVERNGSVIGTLPTAVNLNDVKGVVDGFVYTTDSFAAGATTLVYVDTRNGLNAGVPVWTGGAGETPIIMWAGHSTISAQAASTVYGAWSQLAEPVYAPGSTPLIAPAPDQPLLVRPQDIVTPEATRGFNSVLIPGGLAVIHTTDGDQLNVRSDAGTNYQIVAKLGDGARVTIIEGPQTANGYTWWRIRTSSGISGWVVDSVNDNGKRLETLQPS